MKTIRIIKREEKGIFKTQCVIIRGEPFNIKGWCGKGVRWPDRKEREGDFCCVIRRKKEGIPKIAVDLGDGEEVMMNGRKWNVKSKRLINGNIFAWVEEED